MQTSEWWEHPELGVIQFDVNHKVTGEPHVEGDATVEVSLELWHSILKTLDYEPLDGPPPVG